MLDMADDAGPAEIIMAAFRAFSPLDVVNGNLDVLAAILAFAKNFAKPPQMVEREFLGLLKAGTTKETIFAWCGKRF